MWFEAHHLLQLGQPAKSVAPWTLPESRSSSPHNATAEISEAHPSQRPRMDRRFTGEPSPAQSTQANSSAGPGGSPAAIPRLHLDCCCAADSPVIPSVLLRRRRPTSGPWLSPLARRWNRFPDSASQQLLWYINAHASDLGCS